MSEFFSSMQISTLTEEQKNFLEGVITLAEVKVG